MRRGTVMNAAKPVFSYRNNDGKYLSASEIDGQVDIAVEIAYALADVCEMQMAKNTSNLTFDEAARLRLIHAGLQKVKDVLCGLNYSPEE